MSDSNYEEAKKHYGKGEAFREQGILGSARQEFEAAQKCLEPLKDDERTKIHVLRGNIIARLQIL